MGKRTDPGCGWGFAIYGAALTAVLFIWGWEVFALMIGAFFVLGVICCLLIFLSIRMVARKDSTPPPIRRNRGREEKGGR